ncbi:hypothetical protein ACPOLB_27140 [Rubrivivax sp. RP6-9]|uniref:hypothetical protein n=1 Tax=Rubrivivax sp. RP6-9 TaxID=3415750 RepID=UPI003CC5F8C8
MDMNTTGPQALIMAGALTSLAAVAHLACIVLGASAYRCMGAGERMARAVEAGKFRPTLVTLGIAAVLLSWAAYAFSAAGVIEQLPLAKFVLPAISAVFLARACCSPWVKPWFPGNPPIFWLVSSGICLSIGSLYAWGTAAVWAQL